MPHITYLGKKCAVSGCTTIIHRKGIGKICKAHQARFARRGNYDLSDYAKEYYKPHLTSYGYLRINIGGKRIQQHRYIMEQYLGRTLKRNEVVHHINYDKSDNRLGNLKVMDKRKHDSLESKRRHRLRKLKIK